MSQRATATVGTARAVYSHNGVSIYHRSPSGRWRRTAWFASTDMARRHAIFLPEGFASELRSALSTASKRWAEMQWETSRRITEEQAKTFVQLGA